MWVFVNSSIENPTFDSQTKEYMTLQPKSFGSACKLPEKFFNNAAKCGIVDSVLSWVRFKQQVGAFGVSWLYTRTKTISFSIKLRDSKGQ